MKKHCFASQVGRFCFPWICGKTEAQFGIRNTDSHMGKFLTTFAFDNGTDRSTENVPLMVGFGEEMTVSQTSPFSGVSEFSVGLEPPSKFVNTLSQLRILRGRLR